MRTERVIDTHYAALKKERNMSGRYILDGRTLVPEPDLLKWSEWFKSADRRVAQTVVGDSMVSTVFIGLDHSFSLKGPPVLFETLVFGGPLADEMDRYSTWDEAEAGHASMVERVKAAG